jgi:hypothetical protein
MMVRGGSGTVGVAHDTSGSRHSTNDTVIRGAHIPAIGSSKTSLTRSDTVTLLGVVSVESAIGHGGTGGTYWRIGAVQIVNLVLAVRLVHVVLSD